MNLVNILLLLVIAGVCGFVAAQIMGAKRVNIVVLIVLGFVGAIVGQWIAGFFGLPLLLPINLGARMFPLAWSIIGSIVVVGLFSAIQQH
ncbi:GlsB/YeaQ/YmgE family stress response membrane protein [bacterium]|nr:GlsB/YeaQ/YmgE family stress response membrane protein [bacterium]